MRTMLKWMVAAVLAGMLASCSDKGSPGSDGGTNPAGDGGGGGGGGGGDVEPKILKGRIVNNQGQPIPGAVVFASLALNSGARTRTTTDAQGNYQIPLIALDVPYRSYSWTEVTYHGKKFCLRVSPEESTGYDNFYAREGAIHNFRWRLQGRMEDSGGTPEEDRSWYGAAIRFFSSFEDGDYNSTIELKLTPTGPLIDGSTGTELTRTVELAKNQFALDIPAGAYKLSATRVKSNGTRVPARLGRTSAEGSSEFDYETNPVSTQLECGGVSAISGLDRAVLYVISP